VGWGGRTRESKVREGRREREERGRTKGSKRMRQERGKGTRMRWKGMRRMRWGKRDEGG
jgi:hypothetical protein